MDQALRSHERRWRTDHDPVAAEALLSAASRCGEDALVREVLDACARAWETRRDPRAADAALDFVAQRPDRLELAHLVDRLACAAHARAQARFAEWFPPLARIVGVSPAIRQVRARVATHALSSDPVLLHGGMSGSGYEHTARAIHDLSARPAWGLVHFGGTGRDLVGHELRRVTPAGGTLYAAYADHDDPPGWLELALELCERRSARLVVSAHHPEGWPAALAARAIAIPPLRERLDDLPLLVSTLLARRGVTLRQVPDWLLERLRARPWGGNVRELDFTLQVAQRRGRPSHGGVLDPAAWEGMP